MLEAALALLAMLQTPYQEHQCDSPQSQADMNACAAIDFEQADAELNVAWRTAIASAQEDDRDLDREFDRRPTTEAKLREAQRAWIVFRDAHCTVESYGEARGGSMESMVFDGCRAQLTRERTRHLVGSGCANLPDEAQLNACVTRESASVDVELDREYQAAARRAREADAEPERPSLGLFDALGESQQAWLRYRDDECDRRALEYWGGTDDPVSRANCRSDLTRAR